MRLAYLLGVGMSFSDEELDRQIRWMILKLEPHIKRVLDRLGDTLNLRIERLVGLALQVENIDRTISQIFRRFEHLEEEFIGLTNKIDKGIQINVTASARSNVVVPAVIINGHDAGGEFDGLPVRVRNALRNDNIETIHDLCEVTETSLLRVPNFGLRSLGAVKNFLAKRNLHLTGS
jgi:Bacterial RNA polymerase, alpha chain C terminal domain